jgi:hypothetical protein
LSIDEKRDWAIWQGNGTTHICDLSNPLMERSIEEGMILVKILRNKTYNESAQIYYDSFNLGTYVPLDE